MRIDTPFQGSLFANDFLCDAIVRLDDWEAVGDMTLADLDAAVRDVFDRFPIAGSANESQTEDDLIWPILVRLGWTASLRQQNLSDYGRENVPMVYCSRTMRRKTAPTASPRNGSATR